MSMNPYYCLEQRCDHCGHTIKRGVRYWEVSDASYCSLSCAKSDALLRLIQVYRERKGTQFIHSAKQEVCDGTH